MFSFIEGIQLVKEMIKETKSKAVIGVAGENSITHRLAILRKTV